MIAFWKHVAWAGVFFLTFGIAFAQQPGELLPSPRPLGPPAPPMAAPFIPGPIPGSLYMYGPEPYLRRSHYEVWQNVAVDQQGFFRPLVIASPYGAYYRYDGKPFPWVATHPLEWTPRVVDSASFRSP